MAGLMPTYDFGWMSMMNGTSSRPIRVISLYIASRFAESCSFFATAAMSFSFGFTYPTRLEAGPPA